MRKLLLALVLLFAPVSTDAGGMEPSWWFCKAVGNVDGKTTMVITQTSKCTLPNNYDAREKSFFKYILKATNGKFEASFKPKCRDYIDPKRAEKHRLLEKKTAKEYEFDIIDINWRWTGDVQEQAK